MLAPEYKEVVLAQVEVRQVFRFCAWVRLPDHM